MTLQRFLNISAGAIVGGILFSCLATVVLASDTTKVNLKGHRKVSMRVYKGVPQDSIVRIKGVIDVGMRRKVDEIGEKALKFKTVFLAIDSPGGRLDVTKELINEVQAIKDELDTKVICVAINEASSGAAMLAAYCSEFYMTPGAIYLLHHASMTIAGRSMDIKKTLETHDRFAEVFERRLAWQLGLSYDDYQTLVEDDYMIPAELAVELGFADGLVRSFYLAPEAEKSEANPFSSLFGQKAPK